MYILNHSCKYAGFRGFLRDDAGGWSGDNAASHTNDDEGDDNPCSEDEEFFQGRPDAEEMEEAITKFFDGMEGQERSGFKGLHRFLGQLPCPDVEKVGRSMSHSEAVEGGFQVIPTMNEEEQKRYTHSCTDIFLNTGTCLYSVHTHDKPCMNINAEHSERFAAPSESARIKPAQVVNFISALIIPRLDLSHDFIDSIKWSKRTEQ
jgi:hypothetical protein